MRVTELNGEWISGVIIKGIAKAMMSYNVGKEGDKITIRDTMPYFIPFNGALSDPQRTLTRKENRKHEEV